MRMRLCVTMSNENLPVGIETDGIRCFRKSAPLLRKTVRLARAEKLSVTKSKQ